MTEHEQSLFVIPCRGALNNLKKPVNVSVAHNIGRVGISVGCPFAKEGHDENNSLTAFCTAPTPEMRVSKTRAEKLPECYHLNRRSIID